MTNSQRAAWGITLLASAGIAWMAIEKRSKEQQMITLLKKYDMSTNPNLPRGYRNNNPLNIRFSNWNGWKGKVLPNTDKNNTFEQFISLPYGYRAALITMRNYIKKYGCNTVEKIISRWAPENENNTRAYIQHVCEFAELTPQQAVAINDRDTLTRMAYAMSIIENGNTAETREAGLPDMDIINTAWELL